MRRGSSERLLAASDPLLLHVLPGPLPRALLHLIERFCGSDFCGESSLTEDGWGGAAPAEIGGLLRTTRRKTRRVAFGWRDASPQRGADEEAETAALEECADLV